MAALNLALVGTTAFTHGTGASPIGMLNLETLEMTPAGIERGGLLATVPLAPGEHTEVVQREWTVVKEEFTSIVTDALTNYSETGVTDATQLTQATTSQVAHSNQFNVTASVSGGIGIVTGSASSSFTAQDQNSKSAAESSTQAQQTTKKAASRVTESHKMTISTSSESGSSEATKRQLVNPSATEAMRIDYFSMMRKWSVALYRYGLRLTYDITVPEPGAAMREAYRELAQFQEKASAPFSLDVTYAEITPHQYLALLKKAGALGAQIVPPPKAKVEVFDPGKVKIDVSQPNTIVFDCPVQIDVETGYEIEKMLLNWTMGLNHNPTGTMTILGYDSPIEVTIDAAYGMSSKNGVLLKNGNDNFMAGITGTVTLETTFQYINPAFISFEVHTIPSEATIAQWQASVYSALFNAAQTNYYADQQRLTAQIAALQQQIDSVDTLTLRREENDEIMKCVLRWLLGPSFEFMPKDVVNFFRDSGADLEYGVGFTEDGSHLTGADWNTLGYHEQAISFINQAIDWDTTLFYLYSYFWDVPESWHFIRQIQHPDATRQAFLRAGSARVVLCVRQGWEVAWTKFVELWNPNAEGDIPDHPYLTIAQELYDYDATNYPGIPAANPSGPYSEQTPQVGTTCDVHLAASDMQVVIPVAESTGFVAGAMAIIDSWESKVQETQQIVDVAGDGSSITVQALSYAHNLAANDPYPIVQAGAQGLLVAEWFEYTPTSGTDIAVSSDLTTIA